tara:strand:+ start:224 stop:598 length:375 start_codon:yes stop_codon:yes gene_type:complete
MINLIYAFMILLMYFLAGINKARNFSGTVSGFKNMFFLKKLPNIFYQLAIIMVIILEIVAPIIILYSLQTNLYTDIANYSCLGLGIFTILATLIYHFPPNGSQYYPFIKNVTATGALFLLSTLF